MHGPNSDAGLHDGREDEEEEVARALARGTLAEYLERRPSANEGDDDRSDDEASIESLRDVMVDVVLCQGSAVCGKGGTKWFLQVRIQRDTKGGLTVRRLMFSCNVPVELGGEAMASPVQVALCLAFPYGRDSW